MHRRKNLEQCVFFDGVANTLVDLSLDHNCQIIIGGDFSLDKLGGRIESKSSLLNVDVKIASKVLAIRAAKV